MNEDWTVLTIPVKEKIISHNHLKTKILLTIKCPSLVFLIIVTEGLTKIARPGTLLCCNLYSN